jgi:hypothetical protein
MGMKARPDSRTPLTEWEKSKAKEMGLGVRIYKEMRKAYWAGLKETPLRKFRGRSEHLGAMKCCDVFCSKRSEYVTYLIGFGGRQAFCLKHAEARMERLRQNG